MSDKWIRLSGFVACAAVLAFGQAARAEDVEKRWRVGLALGLADSGDAVRSDAANFLTITDFDDVPLDFFEDPRDDSAQHLALQIETRTLAMLSAQYAATKMFIVDISGGYSKGDVGDVELQAQFDRVTIPTEDRFNFAIFKIPAGEIEMVPLNVTAIARFRPRASFNPYIGIGIGYTWVGFTPSAELDDLSRNMDLSLGRFARLDRFPGGLVPQGPVLDIEGVEVTVDDSWNWHVSGGIEYTFKRKWATYLDLTYNLASQSMLLAFDPPSPGVGISVPEDRVLFTEPEATGTYGAVDVVAGGFVDGGRLEPVAGSSADCDISPQECEFVFEPDGVPDTGLYYIQSGSLNYDDWVLLIGVRYTF